MFQFSIGDANVYQGPSSCYGRFEFQFSIGDARRNVARMIFQSLVFQFSIGDAIPNSINRALILAFQFSIGDASIISANSTRFLTTVSILYWRCTLWSSTCLPQSLSCFNSLLEMPSSTPADILPAEERGFNSLLEMPRRVTSPTGLGLSRGFNSLLEMLLYSCRPQPSTALCFNSLLEMPTTTSCDTL